VGRVVKELLTNRIILAPTSLIFIRFDLITPSPFVPLPRGKGEGLALKGIHPFKLPLYYEGSNVREAKPPSSPPCPVS